MTILVIGPSGRCYYFTHTVDEHLFAVFRLSAINWALMPPKGIFREGAD